MTEIRTMLPYRHEALLGQGLLDYLDRMADLVREYGIAVQGVFPTAEEPEQSSFCYTLGMSEIGQPEVLIAGLSGDTAMALLNHMHNLMLDAKGSLEPGAVWTELTSNEIPMVVCAVTYDVEVGMARRLYGDDVPVVQLIYPDQDGRFPWDTGYALPSALQRDWFIPPTKGSS